MNKLSEIDYYNFEINFNTNNSFYNIQNNLSPIPTFGVEDDRPQTNGELEAKLHPQFITEPLLNNDNCKIIQDTNGCTNGCTNGEDVVGFNFQEVPINWMPDFRM